MSDLLSLLSLGSAGITAQNTGVAVASNNVANVNTDGYSRQRVDLEALQAAPLVGGVRSDTPDRLSDSLLNGRIRTAAGALAMSRAFSDALLDIETDLSGSGPMIHEQMGTLFSRLQAVSAAPTDPISRNAVITAARDLVAGIRRQAAALAEARAQANQRISDNAAQASALARQLAATNVEIGRSNDPVLRDDRDRLAKQLSELVGGSARIDSDGQMRFVLDGGAVLVDGTRAATLETSPGSTGDRIVTVVDGAVRRDIPSAGGKIGADLSLRDGAITQAQSSLDQVAYDFATNMNATHSANAGLDGVTGRAMFVAPTQVSGAAASFALDANLDADPSLLAVASAGAGPGDNRGALALLSLADTSTAGALSFVGNLGAQVATAKATAHHDQLVSDHLGSLRDSISGVDLQEELANLTRFEHASSAMTKFVSTIDDMLGNLIEQL